MAQTGSFERNAFATADARALWTELADARAHPTLDPRLRPFIARLSADLREVRDEGGLDAALRHLAPVLAALAEWPAPGGAPAPRIGRAAHEGDVASWEDRRLLRFGAALSALRALESGPGTEAGRRLALTAVHLGRQGGDAAADRRGSPRPRARLRACGSRARHFPPKRRRSRARSRRGLSRRRAS